MGVGRKSVIDRGNSMCEDSDAQQETKASYQQPERNSGLLPIAMQVCHLGSRSSIPGPALEWLQPPLTSWLQPRGRPWPGTTPAKPLPNSWLLEPEIINALLRPLSFRVVCYIAIKNLKSGPPQSSGDSRRIVCKESEDKGAEAGRLVRPDHEELWVLVLVKTWVFKQEMMKWLWF